METKKKDTQIQIKREKKEIESLLKPYLFEEINSATEVVTEESITSV